MEIPDYLWQQIKIAQDYLSKNQRAIDFALKQSQQIDNQVNRHNSQIDKMFNSPEMIAIRNESEKFSKFNYIIDEFQNRFENVSIVSENNFKNISLKSFETNESINISNAQDVIILDNLLGKISIEDCNSFIHHLAEFTLLGYKHPVGKKIFDFIEKQSKMKSQNNDFYRIRISTSTKGIEYTRSEMFEPQYKSPKQNRFSMIGLNPLYLCSDLNIAKQEVGVEKESKYTYIKIKIKNAFNVLDICDREIPLFNFCYHNPENKNDNLHTEYLLPNYISDCAKYHKFEGIKYMSIYDKNVTNLVLFSAGKRDFEIVDISGVNYKN